MKRFTQVKRLIRHTALYGPRGGITVTWVVEGEDGNTYQRTKKGTNALTPPVRVQAGLGIYTPPVEEQEPMSTNHNTNKVNGAVDHLREVTDTLEATLEYAAKEICQQVQDDILDAADRLIHRRKLASTIVRMEDNDDALELALEQLATKREELEAKLAGEDISPVRKHLWQKRLQDLQSQEKALCEQAGLLPAPKANGKEVKRDERGRFVKADVE